MTAFERLLSLLEARAPLKRQGHNWRTLCPVHDDHRPSLDLAESDDGRPLLICRSHRCDPSDILAALGTSWLELLGDDRGEGEWTPRGTAVAVYHYVDERGRLLYDVCRTADKQFPQRRPDPSSKTGWRWSLGSTRRVLYRLPEVLAAVWDEQPIYICEGEKDVEAVRAAGAAATCNPGGAKKWRHEYAEPLRDATCIIVADRDEEGEEHARLVADSLRKVNATVRVVHAREGKDASDHLRAGHALDDLEAAETPAPVSPLAMTVAEFCSYQEASSPPLLGSDDDVIVPAGGLIVVAGPAGIGKTTLVVDCLFHLASGRPWLELPCQRPLSVLIVENEGPREQFRRKIDGKRRLWNRKLHGAIWIQVWRWGSFSIADDEAALRLGAFCEEHEIDLVVGDPLGTLGIAGVGSPDDTREFVLKLRALGLTDKRAFLFLHHFRKEKASDEIDQISGAWGAHLDALLVLKATARPEEVRLSFPKLRWAASERKPLILGRIRTKQTFELLGEEDDPQLLEQPIAELLADGKRRTTREIAAGVSARRIRVERCLAENTHLFRSLPGKDAGRPRTKTVWEVVPGLGTTGTTSENALQTGMGGWSPDSSPPVRGREEEPSQPVALTLEEQQT